MLSDFFIFLAQCVSLYSTLCLIRIILSWFPGVLYSPVGMFFSTVCDPFLNLFRRFRIFKNSPVDFHQYLLLQPCQSFRPSFRHWELPM